TLSLHDALPISQCLRISCPSSIALIAVTRRPEPACRRSPCRAVGGCAPPCLACPKTARRPTRDDWSARPRPQLPAPVPVAVRVGKRAPHGDGLLATPRGDD